MTLRRLNKAFEAFFRRAKEGEKPGCPRFKGRGRFDTVDLVEGNGAKWDSQPHHPTATYVHIQGVGHVRVHQYRPVAGRIKTPSVKREGARWYMIVCCQDVPAAPLPATGSGLNKSILDVGWGMFLRTLPGKTESAGRQVISVNPANTSRTCPRPNRSAAVPTTAKPKPTSSVCGAGTPRTPIGLARSTR